MQHQNMRKTSSGESFEASEYEKKKTPCGESYIYVASKYEQKPTSGE